MWIPDRFGLPRDQAEATLSRMGAADLITPVATAEGPAVEITFLPLVFDAGGGENGVLRGHLARQNPHVAALRSATAASTVIVHPTDAYISPTWYASKATNPRTVPTWNYTTVHAHGRVDVIDDPDWLLAHLRTLSDRFEAPLARPDGDEAWSLDDAPADYLAGMVRAIVGVELVVERVEAKAKQSQNKSPEDVAGVVAGLRTQGADAAADEVERANREKEWPPPRLKHRS